MTKQEIGEIKKLFKMNSCSIDRVTGCYVDGEKNIRATFMQPLLSMPEEEIFKYLEILKKSLSGSLEKNLHTIEFSLDAEQDGGQQNELLKLRDSKLKNPDALLAYYQRIIDSYKYVGNYLILVFHDAYDVPGKAKDGETMTDASDEVYEYILTCICPVELAKPGLYYNENAGKFENLNRPRMVGAPDAAFLFPAFNDRCSDIHSILCYEKKPEDKKDSLMEAVIGKTMPLTAGEQKETFNALIEETLGENCAMEIVKSIHEKLTEKIENHKEESEPLMLGKEDIKSVFADSGVSNDKMRAFDEHYEQTVGNVELAAENVVSAKALEVKSPDIVIKVSPDRTDLLDTAVVNGRRCLVIEMGSNVMVNGVQIQERLEGEA